jgi:predicted nucleotidyltransferase
MENLNNLLKTLLESKIDFVLIGGYAAVLHGSSQVTQDVDICAVMTEAQLTALRMTLKDFKPVHRMNPDFQPSLLDVPKPGQKMNNIYLRTDLGILDILENVEPVGDFHRVNEKAIEISLFGHKCKVISLDDLIAVKKSMPRPKDKSVLLELLALKSKT